MIRQPLAKTIPPLSNSSNGFTVIEFVIVIVLIAIIGAVTLSRFIEADAFRETIVRDQIISLTRVAQQFSLGRTGANLTVQPNGGGTEVTITASDDGGTIQSATISLDSVTISGDINTTDTCDSTLGANAITNAAPMVINFDELGDLVNSGVTGSIGAVTSALRICLNDSAEGSLCVSPAGFAYAGACDV